MTIAQVLYVLELADCRSISAVSVFLHRSRSPDGRDEPFLPNADATPSECGTQAIKPENIAGNTQIRRQAFPFRYISLY